MKNLINKIKEHINTKNKKISENHSNYKNHPKSAKNIKYKLSLSLIIILLLTSCTRISSQNPTINGAQLEASSQKFDELNIQMVVDNQKDKYIRHYQNNLYYEDLSDAQAELNKLYNEYLTKKLYDYIKLEVPQIKDSPYILKTQIEYVNEDAKKYSQGKIKAEEIIDNPNSMMSVKIQWYIFEDFKKLRPTIEESQELGEKLSREFLEKEIVYKYIINNIENFQINVRAYPKETLDKYDIKEIEKQKNIEIFLQEEGKKSTYEGHIYNNYFSQPNYFVYEVNSMFDIVKKKKYQEELKQRYNIDFYESEGYYMPKDNPNLFFKEYYDADNTHFQEIMYQNIVNKRVRKLIDEAGLSDKVVFLVTAESMSDPMKIYSTAKKPYNFGEGFDEDYFLKKGYTGRVYVTLIYLDTIKNKEILENREKKYKYIDDTIDNLKEKILYPLHEQISFGTNEEPTESVHGSGGSFKTSYVYFYNVKEYDKKIIVDLFKKYPLTEREHSPELTLANVFSLAYDTRAETPGFHYLDIFGEYIIDEEEHGDMIKKEMENKTK